MWVYVIRKLRGPILFYTELVTSPPQFFQLCFYNKKHNHFVKYMVIDLFYLMAPKGAILFCFFALHHSAR